MTEESAEAPPWLEDLIAQGDSRVSRELVERWARLPADDEIGVQVTREGLDALISLLNNTLHSQQQLVFFSLGLANGKPTEAEKALEEYGKIIIDSSRKLDQFTSALLASVLKDAD